MHRKAVEKDAGLAYYTQLQSVMRHSSSKMSLKLISSLSALVAVTAVPKLAAADSSDSTIGASINSDGVTELFGDSFGEPGAAAEYDYVVSRRSGPVYHSSLSPLSV